MKWKVFYDKLVYTEDLKVIDYYHRNRIIRVADKKLSTAHDKYGYPLSGKYHGLWKLQIRDYRVIYLIKKT